MYTQETFNNRRSNFRPFLSPPTLLSARKHRTRAAKVFRPPGSMIDRRATAARSIDVGRAIACRWKAPEEPVIIVSIFHRRFLRTTQALDLKTYRLLSSQLFKEIISQILFRRTFLDDRNDLIHFNHFFYSCAFR